MSHNRGNTYFGVKGEFISLPHLHTFKSSLTKTVIRTEVHHIGDRPHDKHDHIGLKYFRTIFTWSDSCFLIKIWKCSWYGKKCWILQCSSHLKHIFLRRFPNSIICDVKFSFNLLKKKTYWFISRNRIPKSPDLMRWQACY